MKSKLILIGLLAAVVPTAAVVMPTDASAQAFYFPGGLHYRDNDPFVFCTQGRKEESKCWIPLSPQSGTHIPLCYYPYWSTDDWVSLGEYMLTCPHGGAGSAGDWKGKGKAEDSPTSH